MFTEGLLDRLGIEGTLTGTPRYERRAYDIVRHCIWPVTISDLSIGK
jgi:hypothetical protein